MGLHNAPEAPDEAQFRLCHVCRLHGHIVVPDGRNTPETGCLPHAEAMVHAGLRHRVFGAEDAERLLIEIQAAGLPSTFEAIDLALQWKLELWNMMVADRDVLVLTEFEALHQYLAAPVFEAMPSVFPSRVQAIFARGSKGD